MRLLFIVGTMMLYSIPVSAQVLTGRVVCREGALSSVNIWIMRTFRGTVSDEDGRFRLSLSPENRTDTIAIACIGYRTKKLPVADTDFSKEIQIMLEETSIGLNEVTVVAQRPIAGEFSVQKMNRLSIYQNPTGNADPLKALIGLSASTNTDESANPSLRGSSPARSRIVLNGVPVHHPVKFGDLNNMGHFSLFNTGLIDTEYVYASNPPLTYGNATAGIVEIETSSKLDENSVELSCGLGGAGIMYSRMLGIPDNFIRLYGNYQYGSSFLAINRDANPRVKGFESYDVGFNIHSRAGKYTSINLYLYVIEESSEYLLNNYGYEEIALTAKNRVFGIAAIRHQRGKHVFILNYGGDWSKESVRFGNMNYKPISMQHYASLEYKRIGERVVLQTGFTFEQPTYRVRNSRVPLYYYALSSDAPWMAYDNAIKNQSLETYLSVKWDITPKLIVFGALRTNIFSSDDMFLSRQSGIKWHFTTRSRLLFSAGKYNGRNIPDYYMSAFVHQTAIHYSLEYAHQSDRGALGAAVYYKTETGDYITNYVDQSDRRKIFGTEIHAERKIFRRFNLSGSYTYLRSLRYDGNRSFNSANNVPYIVKLTGSYQNLKIGSFSLSYITRAGSWYTPVTSGEFDISAGTYKPIYGPVNSERMSAYGRFDFAANKFFFFGKYTLLVYFTVNNVLNARNKQSRVYTADYTGYEYEYFGGRVFYFGVTLNL